MCSNLFVISLVLWGSTCLGQLTVPNGIELNGAQNSDKQVLGLAFPETANAAISAEAVRSNSTTYTEVTGGSVLNGALTPALSNYTAGLVVQVVPQTTNNSNALLNLNNLGARPILKAGGLPLDSADLWPLTPARMIYDGQNFILLSTVAIPCLKGFHVGGREYCIEDSSRGPLIFSEAALACNAAGARLCTPSEWVYACRSLPTFLATVLDYEWVNNAANHLTGAKLVGYGYDGMNEDIDFGCERGMSAVPATLTRFRCCMTR